MEIVAELSYLLVEGRQGRARCMEGLREVRVDGHYM